jgi:hypothetical protein
LKLRQLHALKDHIEEQQQQLNENADVGNELNEVLVVIEMEMNYINLFVQAKIDYRRDLTLQNRLTSSFTLVELYQWIGFTRAHLYQVSQLLQIPFDIEIDRQSILGETALLLYLHQEKRINTVDDCGYNYGIDGSFVSKVYNFMKDFIFHEYAHCVLNNLDYYVPNLDTYIAHFQKIIADGNHGLVFNRTATCGASIDGTFIPIARPSVNERLFYNGYYGHCGYTVQAIVFPDGLAAINLPMPSGMGTDWTAWQRLPHKRQLININAQRALENKTPFSILGDAMYNDMVPELLAMHRPLPRQRLPEWAVNENRHLEEVRAENEHAFKKVKERSTILRDYTNKLKVRATKPLKTIVNAFLFANIHTCLYGNQVSLKFGLPSPSVEHYLEQQKPDEFDALEGFFEYVRMEGVDPQQIQ